VHILLCRSRAGGAPVPPAGQHLNVGKQTPSPPFSTMQFIGADCSSVIVCAMCTLYKRLLYARTSRLDYRYMQIFCAGHVARIVYLYTYLYGDRSPAMHEKKSDESVVSIRTRSRVTSIK